MSSPDDRSPQQPAPGPGDPDGPVPGPLGWLELTVQLMRDRSHSSWMLLRDEELLEAVRARGAVAAYLPGEALATPDLVLLRVAVSPDGRVALARDGGAPEPGPAVEEFVPSLLDELKTVGFVPGDGPVGPPWLPTEEIVAQAHQPDESSRVVYAYRSDDLLTASAFAKGLGVPLTVYREDGWVVAATPHRPDKVLSAPPSRLTGAYPFVVMDRRGQGRTLAYAQSPKKSALSFSAEWQPPLRPVTDDGHPDALSLQQWLADPALWEREHAGDGPLPQRPRPDGMDPDQHALVERWMSERDDASGFFAEVGAAFGVPDVAARLAEAAPGEPDPPGGQQVAPGSTGALAVQSILEQDTEPEGSMPWTVLSRAIWRRPWLGIALGAGELLVAVVLAGMLLGGVLHGWWMWVVAAVFALGGLAHLGESLFRLRMRGRPQAEDPEPH